MASEFDCPTPTAAADQCAERMRKVLREFADRTGDKMLALP